MTELRPRRSRTDGGSAPSAVAEDPSRPPGPTQPAGPRTAGAADGAPSGPPASGALVVGFGNTLRGDDGVGPRVAASLRADGVPDDTQVLARHQLVPELAWEVAAAERVIFVDARADAPPGDVQVRRVRADARPPAAITHRVEPGRLLHLARVLFGRAPRDCWLVTVGGASFVHGEGLSRQVAAAVPRVHRLVHRLLRAH